MSDANIDVFDIEASNRRLEEKCKTSDYILFETQIPTTDFISDVEIVQGNDSTPYASISNYFLTYGILHELLQIYNNTKKETFDFFTKKILERKETSISELKKIISKREKIEEKDLIGFDFGYPEFFINNKDKNIKYNKGSDMTNFSYCYNNISTPMKILNIFLLKDIKQENVIIIKSPNIISTVMVDYVKLLSYVFKQIRIFKVVQDSFFKDSFHIIVSNPNIARYNKIKTDIKNNIKKNHITDIEKSSIKNILKYTIDDNNKEFEIKIKEFANVLEILIATYLLDITKALRTSTMNNHRDPYYWRHLDFYFSKCL
ncbi:putative mRNA-capping enzyme small subunit [Yalta virus]|nr:putative mRNA-capping enzyme small subunit [Yalta virus]